jgi:hypothetical protein
MVHTQFLHTLDELLNVREAIEHGVFRVDVEMGKGHVRFGVGEVGRLGVERYYNQTTSRLA